MRRREFISLLGGEPRAELEQQLEACRRELAEAREQQTATSEVLNVISRSSTQLQPVLDSIVATAANLCQADFAMIHTLEHGRFRLVAANKAGSELHQVACTESA